MLTFQLYWIWSIEHNAWWAPSRHGYVELRINAGKYKYDEAYKIVTEANAHKIDSPNEAMIPVIE